MRGRGWGDTQHDRFTEMATQHWAAHVLVNQGKWMKERLHPVEMAWPVHWGVMLQSGWRGIWPRWPLTLLTLLIG